MDDFERDDLEEKPLEGEKFVNVFASLFEEDKGSEGYEVIDNTFQIFDHGRQDCWKNYGDPIYDTSSDVSNEEIADFESWGQPNMK